MYLNNRCSSSYQPPNEEKCGSFSCQQQQHLQYDPRGGHHNAAGIEHKAADECGGKKKKKCKKVNRVGEVLK